MAPVPAARVVQHVALLEDARADHAGHVAVREPLRPREMVVADPPERERRLALERDAGPGRVDRAPKLRPRLLHRVEEHAVDPEVGHQRGDRLLVGDGLAARADVPRVVVDEDPQAARPEPVDERVQLGHVAVEVELVARVDPDHGIRMPEHDAVEAAELGLAVVDEAVGGEAASLVVVEEVVPEPRQGDGEARLRPGGLGGGVRRGVVGDAGPGLVPPPRERLAPGGPVGRVVRGRDDLRAVERLERLGRVERRGQVERPRDERIARELGSDRHAWSGAATTASVRRTSSSTPIPSRPGSEVAKRPSSGAVQRASMPAVPTVAPRSEPTAAPFVSVSQPPCDRRADRAGEVAVEGVERGRRQCRVVDRVHPVEVADRLVEPVDDRLPVPPVRQVACRRERLAEPARRRDDGASGVGALGRRRARHRVGVRRGHEHRGVDAVRGVADPRVRPRHPGGGHGVAGSRPAVRVDAQAGADPLTERVAARRGLRRAGTPRAGCARPRARR